MFGDGAPPTRSPLERKRPQASSVRVAPILMHAAFPLFLAIVACNTRNPTMAIVTIFTPAEMTVEQYDEAVKRLESAGAGQPPGRLYHVMCFDERGHLRVVDVWESREAFDRFGETLMPIFEDIGVDPGQPQVSEVHNILG